MVHSGYRPVGRDFNYVHAVNVTEFSFFRKSGTGHTGFLGKQVEEVLEGNGSKGLAFSLDLYMLLGFDRLMQAVGIAASRHDTSGKLVYNKYLVVLYHIILVTEHQVVGTERQNNVMLDFQIFRVCKVVNLEESFYFFHAGFGQVDNLVLFIDNEITGFFLYHAHHGVNLGKLCHIFTTLHLARQDITGFVQSGGLAALTGNNQRGTGFIDENGVHFIDDGIV